MRYVRVLLFLIAFPTIALCFWFLDLQATDTFLDSLFRTLAPAVVMPAVEFLGFRMSLAAIVLQCTITFGQLVMFHRLSATSEIHRLSVIATVVNFAINIVIVFTSWIESDDWLVRACWTLICSPLTVLAPELLAVIGCHQAWMVLRAQASSPWPWPLWQVSPWQWFPWMTTPPPESSNHVEPPESSNHPDRRGPVPVPVPLNGGDQRSANAANATMGNNGYHTSRTRHSSGLFRRVVYHDSSQE
jgi:hypothetical protein